MERFSYEDSRHYSHFDEQGNFVCRRVYFIKEGTTVPGHACIRENRVIPCDGFFDVSDILLFVRDANIQPQMVRFEDIWYALRFENEREMEQQSDRFRQADTRYPGLLAPLANPAGKKFRMLDGRRRMWKLQQQGHTEGMFFIAPVPEIFRYFWMLQPQKLSAKTGV